MTTIYSPAAIFFLRLVAFLGAVIALARMTRHEWTLGLDSLAIATLFALVAKLMREVNDHFAVGVALLSLPTERRAS